MGRRHRRRDHPLRDLELAPLPDDLRDAIDAKLPPRWSRNNPIDLAGGETRDTIPEVLELVAGHPDVDAVVYLGLGIQSNQARLMRDGRFYPGDGLERIVAYHERQDARFAQAAAEICDATGKPILTATELAVAAPTTRAAHGPRDRAALLPVVEPGGHRARAPVPLRALPRPARPRVTDGPPRRAAGTTVRRVLGGVAARRRRGRSSCSGCAARRGAGRAHRPRPSARRCGRCAASRSPSSTPSARSTSRPRSTSRTAGLSRARRCGTTRRGGDVTTAGTRRRSAPGSTQKLLTATAALDVLGPDFHFTTKAVAPG